MEVPLALTLVLLAVLLVEVESMVGGHGVLFGYYLSSRRRRMARDMLENDP
jgi:hypothetical protein